MVCSGTTYGPSSCYRSRRQASENSLITTPAPIDVATATKAQAAEGRIDWLDFLRGAAALAVVLFHVRVTLWVGWRVLMTDESSSSIDRALAWITLPFPFFGTTVMLFFVVSGFAIHYPYALAGTTFAAGPYALRRVFRIYPAYLAVVLLTVAAEQTAAALGNGAPSTWGKVLASAAMAQNYLPPAGQMAGNPALWSLPVEVELYLAYPLLLWIWRRAGTRNMLLLVAAVSICAALPLLKGHQWPMGNFAKYWIIWVSGAVLAQQLRTNRLPVWRVSYTMMIVAGLGVAVAARAVGIAFGFEHFIWGGIYFLVTFWGLAAGAPLRHVPVWIRRSMNVVGEMSYSLYLIHFPLFLVLGACWMAVFGTKPANVLVPLAMTLLSLPCAYLLWRLIELPSQGLGRNLALRSAANTERLQRTRPAHDAIRPTAE